MSTKMLCEKKSVKQVKVTAEKPKRLSKAGEWMKANPNGIIKILDMRAVLR